MLGKELLDLLPVGVDLLLDLSEQARQRKREPGFGAGERFTRGELAGAGEDSHSFLVGLGTGPAVRVKELFPPALAGVD